MAQTVVSIVPVEISPGVKVSVNLMLPGKKTNLKKKIETLRHYIERYPSGWKKRLELADLLCYSGCWENAIAEYKNILERKPDLIEIWLKLGKIFYLSGAIDRAAKAYERALSLSANQPISEQINALIDLCYGRYIHAIDSMQSAIASDPTIAAHWLSLGCTYLLIDSPYAALEAFRQALDCNPDDVMALRYCHDTLLVLGDIQQASRILEQLFGIAPDRVSVLERVSIHNLRKRLVRGKAGQETVKLIRKAMKVAPDIPSVHALFAYYSIYTGDWCAGVERMKAFVEAHPNNPSSWYVYARILLCTGNFLMAEESLHKAYQLYPNDFEIYRAFFEILPLVGGHDRLQLLAGEILDRFPERWSSWAIVGNYSVEHLGLSERGVELSARCIQLQPNLADAWFQYGRALLLSGCYADAIAALKQGWEKLPASEGTPQSIPAAMWLGKSYHILEDEPNSQHWWNTADYHAQKLAEFHPSLGNYWRGKALQALGEEKRATELFQKALEQQLPYPARQTIH